MIIGIDFDGTCVSHAYPEIGKDIGAVPYLKRMVEKGYRLVLITMRSHPAPQQSDPNLRKQGLIPISAGRDTLREAVEWFERNEIPLWGINENPTQKYWTRSPKIYANIYIDDTCVCIPLKQDNPEERPYVDWEKLGKWLENEGIL